MKKMPKKITIDQLAVMIKEGFENTASKDELRDVEQRLNKRIDGVENGLKKLDTTVKDLKRSFESYRDVSDKKYIELKRNNHLV